MLSETEVRVLDRLADKEMPIVCDETDESGTLAAIGGITVPDGALVKEIRNESMHKRIYDVGSFRVIHWLMMSENHDGKPVLSFHRDDVQ